MAEKGWYPAVVQMLLPNILTNGLSSLKAGQELWKDTKIKCCSKFPEYTDKRVEFVEGWPGTLEGYKEEMLQRYDKYHDSEKHHKCAKAWEKLGISDCSSHKQSEQHSGQRVGLEERARYW